MTAPATLARGARFRHARQLDLDWTPGPGEKWRDAPHRVMVVSQVTRSRVYYRPEGVTWAAFYSPRDSFGEVVGEWL